MIVAKSDMTVVLPRRLTQHVALSMPVTLVPLPVEVAPFALTMIWHERTHDDPAHDVNTMEVVTYGRTGTTGQCTGRQVSIRNACGRSHPAGANGNDRATRYRHDDRGQRHDGRNAPVAGKAPHKQPGKRLRRVIQQDDDTRRLAVVPRRDDSLPCTAYVHVEDLMKPTTNRKPVAFTAIEPAMPIARPPAAIATNATIPSLTREISIRATNNRIATAAIAPATCSAA
ncbi:type 2 periplasmic-binding domain-containing protein [Burkholderia cepacia]|uniref:hypothetical protein n=1 Tax=Burkholderia cepacia TaxID=292 RepID=UPI002ABE510A|nr:hypothetical protein [Burkholderia cepacia]